MNIGIIGIGAVGSFVISQLLTEYNLSFFNRSDKSFVKVKTFYKNLVIPISLSTSGQNKIDFDWLIVCVKEDQTNEIVKTVGELVNTNTKLVVIRNGMKLKDPFLDLVPEEQILPCSIDCSIQPDEKNVYHQKSDAYITIPCCELGNEFQSLFSKHVISFETTDDFHTKSWKKLIESSALGGVMAITQRYCEVFREDQYLSLFKQLVSEGIEVAKADNAKLPFYFFNELEQKLFAYPKDKGSSMLTDVLAGRQVELGAKNGYISKMGKQYGIDTIEHDKIIRILSSDN
jgi:2-dehydropantoate 2-reductase